MLNEASGIYALTDDELHEVSGGVGLVVTVVVLAGALVAGLAVGTYLKHKDQAASGGKVGDYPTQPTATA
jgi:lactobin A/cerein 7B family class IIb bacteriocin